MSRNRLLNIQNGYNYRDIGGYLTKDGLMTRWHKIVRSGNLADLTPAEQTYLHNYGVICDVDLRSNGEIKKEPDRVPKGVKFFHVPIHGDRRPASWDRLKVKFSNDPTLGHQKMVETYKKMASAFRDRWYFRKLFRIFLKYGNKGAVLFHCAQGKDRTGWGVAMLLLTLGVNLDTVKKDYLISAQQMVPYVKIKQDYYRSKGANGSFLENIKALYTVSSDYFAAAIQEVRKKYGTWANFEKKYLHLSPKDVQKLKDMYLEDPNR